MRLAVLSEIIHSLENQLNELIESPGPQSKIEALEWLNGRTGSEISKSMPRIDRKNGDIFLTGAYRSGLLFRGWNSRLRVNPTILDPACGSGDLLLSAAKRLPVGPSPQSTLQLWGNCLVGWDLQPDLVKITKLRLGLLAVVRVNEPVEGEIDVDAALPEIKQLDATIGFASQEKYDLIAMNPPFSAVRKIKIGAVKATKTTQAGWFLEKAVTALKPKGHLLALLPEVLRSGSSYERLREFVENELSISRIDLLDQFGSDADIHTFLIAGMKGNSFSKKTWKQANERIHKEQETLAGHCDVKTGSVVPHRDPEQFDLKPYLTSHDLSKTETLKTKDLPKRGFKGEGIRPPFVAIGRTSRPGDIPRINATIVTSGEAVLIENHVVAIQPHVNSREACEQLVERLHSTYVESHLDRRIRLRHLTIDAIRGIPWQ